jgi:hypothetical protein
MTMRNIFTSTRKFVMALMGLTLIHSVIYGFSGEILRVPEEIEKAKGFEIQLCNTSDDGLSVVGCFRIGRGSPIRLCFWKGVTFYEVPVPKDQELVYPNLSPDGSKLFAVTRDGTGYLSLFQWSTEALTSNSQAEPTARIRLNNTSILVAFSCSRTGETISVIGRDPSDRLTCTPIINGQVCNLPEPARNDKEFKYVVALPHQERTFTGLIYSFSRGWLPQIYTWNLQDASNTYCKILDLPSSLDIANSLSASEPPEIRPSQQLGDSSIGLVFRTGSGKTVFCSYTEEGIINYTQKDTPYRCFYKVCSYSSKGFLLSCRGRDPEDEVIYCSGDTSEFLGTSYRPQVRSQSVRILSNGEISSDILTSIPSQKEKEYLFFSRVKKAGDNIKSGWKLNCYRPQRGVVFWKLNELLSAVNIRGLHIIDAFIPICANHSPVCYIHVVKHKGNPSGPKMDQHVRQIVRLHIEGFERKLPAKTNETSQASSSTTTTTTTTCASASATNIQPQTPTIASNSTDTFSLSPRDPKRSLPPVLTPPAPHTHAPRPAVSIPVALLPPVLLPPVSGTDPLASTTTTSTCITRSKDTTNVLKDCTDMLSNLFRREVSRVFVTTNPSTHKNTSELHPQLQLHRQSSYNVPSAVTSSASHKRKREEEENTEDPQISPVMKLQYGIHGIVLNSRYVLTSVSSGTLSHVIAGTSVYEVADSVAHSNLDLKISELDNISAFPGDVLEWSSLSIAFSREGERSSKRARLPDEIKVVVVSGVSGMSDMDAEINEHGIFTRNVLTLGTEKPIYLRGTIQRSDLENKQICFRSSEPLTLQHNGAPVFIEDEQGELHFIGIVSGHLMREDSQAPILNLTHPEIIKWIVEQCSK